MTVRELINELQEYDADMMVVMKPENSHYVHSPQYVNKRNVNSFWGSDYEAVVIKCDQVGSV